MAELLTLFTPLTFFISICILLIGLIFLIYKKDNVKIFNMSFGKNKDIKKEYKLKLCESIKFEWVGEQNDTGIRIRSNLIQLFGIFNTTIHRDGLSYLREVWPSKKGNIIIDVTDANIPSTLLGIISEKENQRIYIIHRAIQNDNIAVLKKYKNVKLINING